MEFLFKKRNKNKTIAIFDIGSSSIGGAIVRIPILKEELPTILKSIRVEINYNKNKIDTHTFTKSMLKSLNLTANTLCHNNSVGAPDEIICVLASPWYSMETKLIKLKKERPFIFTKKNADELIKKEIRKTIKEHTLKNKAIYNKLEIIENHIMKVSLNGYQTENPIGLKTESVEMDIVMSFSEKFFLDKIRRIISETYQKTPISFSSFIISSYFSIRDRYICPDSYLLLDIGGEITEVGIISKSILKATLSFPFGKKTFFKYISTKLGIEIRDAIELFHLYISGDLSKEKKVKVAPLFKSAESLWSESFRQCISKLPYVLAIPGTIFLTADSDVNDYFSKIIRNEKFIQSMTIEHKCNVIELKGTEFLKMLFVIHF